MYVLVFIGLFSLVTGAPGEKRQDEHYFMENKCSMSDRDASCPHGYCCAYDEFFRIIYYCKKLGAVGDSCSTVASDADCPCEEGLTCVPTVQGSTFVTIYGHCQKPAASTNAGTTNNGHHEPKHG
ncbi:uncharacterized protein LOC133204094 [Saccostrea echinata]|uniref:uncharacterized protein LOC133204094 n=1 Tax=Saccostrea echinata TaxID=191078 RepID=UPI002A7F2ED0|nr:uncharacterized protein LOC133204094 [Saccostrea echinata]